MNSDHSRLITNLDLDGGGHLEVAMRQLKLEQLQGGRVRLIYGIA